MIVDGIAGAIETCSMIVGGRGTIMTDATGTEEATTTVAAIVMT